MSFMILCACVCSCTHMHVYVYKACTCLMKVNPPLCFQGLTAGWKGVVKRGLGMGVNGGLATF